MIDLYRERPVALLPSPELRMSPAGVLVKRDVRREPGWLDPHWTVLDVPAGDRLHWVGQHIVDQAVAEWSVLVRRERVGGGSR